jgi:hypothetical protein
MSEPVIDPDRSGPHLAAAFVAEKVLQEQDGVLTPVRIIDRMMFLIPSGQDHPEPVPLTLVVALKSGGARGSYPLAVTLENPIGQQIPLAPPNTVFLEGEERGVNLLVPFAFAPEIEGLYWFDVYFDGQRITRVPLRAMYQRVQLPPEIGSS